MPTFAHVFEYPQALPRIHHIHYQHRVQAARPEQGRVDGVQPVGEAW